MLDLADVHRAGLNFLGNNLAGHAFPSGTGTGYSVLEVPTVFEKYQYTMSFKE